MHNSSAVQGCHHHCGLSESFHNAIQAARALLNDHQIRRVATGDARRTSFHDAAAGVLRPTLQAVAAGTLVPSPLRVGVTATQLSAQALLGANKAKAVRISPAKLSLVGKSSRKNGVELSLNAGWVSVVVAAPSFASTSAGLRLAGSSGQLGVTMTLVSGGPAHVAALKSTLTAARATGQKCKSLAVTATVYLDFTSCAAWNAYVTSLGGEAYTAGSCSGNIKRVVVSTPFHSERIHHCCANHACVSSSPGVQLSFHASAVRLDDLPIRICCNHPILLCRTSQAGCLSTSVWCVTSHVAFQIHSDSQSFQ